MLNFSFVLHVHTFINIADLHVKIWRLIIFVACQYLNKSCYYIFQAPTIAAAAYLRMAGRPPVLPSSSFSYSENFLYMLDSLYVLFDIFGPHLFIYRITL